MKSKTSALLSDIVSSVSRPEPYPCKFCKSCQVVLDRIYTIYKIYKKLCKNMESTLRQPEESAA